MSIPHASLQASWKKEQKLRAACEVEEDEVPPFLSCLPTLLCRALQESSSPHLCSSHSHLRLSCTHCLLQGLTEDEEQRRAARNVGDDVVPEPHKPQEAPIKEDAEQVVPVRLDSGNLKEEGMESAAQAAREDAQVRHGA